MVKVFLKTVQVLVILSLVFAFGCKKDEGKDDGGGKDGTNQPPTCEITNPKDNAYFSTDENIAVTVVAEDKDGYIVEVQLYVDNVGHSVITEFPYNFTINAGELAPGMHTLKAIAKDDQGANGESTVSIIVEQPNTESPDFVTFSDGKIPNTWHTTAWAIDNTVGYDDIYSLAATTNKAAVVTNKTYDDFGHVEFYTASNNYYDPRFLFYIDGVATDPIHTSTSGIWKKWVYGFSSGAHIFKWETTSSYKINLDAIKFAPSGLPYVYTTGFSQSFNSATISYDVSTNGTFATHGVCWSTTPNPTIDDDKTINSGTINDLIKGTTYYIRAYATNAVGTAYSDELNLIGGSGATALSDPVEFRLGRPAHPGFPATDMGITWTSNIDGMTAKFTTASNSLVMLNEPEYNAITTREGLAKAFYAGYKLSEFTAKADFQFTPQYLIVQDGTILRLIKMTDLKFGEAGQHKAWFIERH
ncbi:MAG: Ig-like domain-containing protein [Bacteroidales bacterium]|nr:Ig-like domain-containing protein [Bacteroidales bacterium]